MENQRTFLYLSLVFVGFLLWQAWMADQAAKHAPPPVAASQSAPAPAQASIQEPASDTPNPAARAPGTPPEARAESTGAGATRTIEVSTDVLRITMGDKGGDLLEAWLPAYPISIERRNEPLQLLRRPPKTYIAQSGLLAVDGAARAPTHHATFEVGAGRFVLGEGENELRVPLTWRSADGVEVTKTYVFRRGSYLIDILYTVRNGSATPWTGRQYRQLRHGPVDASKSSMFVYTYTGAAYYTDKYEKLSFDDFAKKPLNLDLKGGWAAITEHYFLSALLANGPDDVNQVYTKNTLDGGSQEHIIGLLSPEITIAPGETGELRARLYVGPKLQKDLEALSPGLELTADYGIFAFLAKPLFWLLSLFHDWTGNWGWAIILLTVLIKAVFYKPSEMSYRSMAKMRAVAPKLQQIKERYGDDKQRQQQALMDLYKKEKINPLGGCLPIFIQIPVFIALYWVLLETVELRQAPWMFWIKDLSIKDPYFILPLLMGVTMFIQQKLNPPPPDPIQAKVMMALPFVFTVFFAFFPAGLVLYWFVNNLLSIAQQGWITHRLGKETKAS